jgi:hypothetical protein
VSLEQLNAALNKVAETLPALSPAEMPFPDVSFQPDPVDYPVSDFQSFVPTPNSEFEAPSFPPVAGPLPVVPPSLEMNFHVDAPPNSLQQSEETCAVADEKILVKPRRNARSRAHRARAR